MRIRGCIRRLPAVLLALCVMFTGVANAVPSAPGSAVTPEHHRPRPARVSGGWQWPVLPAPPRPPSTRPDPKDTTTNPAATDTPRRVRTYPSAPGADPGRGRSCCTTRVGCTAGWASPTP